LNPILYSIYHFLKGVTLLAFRIYYPKTTKLNIERLKFKRPSILVSNHPNTLLDPLNAGKEVPMVIHFLANASLFQGKFQSWFFNTFYCIPIERPQDTKGRPINNKQAFARCDKFLGNGGCLYIAPEGGSDMERRLRPIKTGTARIALSAEQAKDFKLGLIIQPVGLTYDAPNYFDSRLLLNAGEPIVVGDYQSAYEQDPIGTVRQLTADLENRMRELLIDTRDEQEDRLIKKLETLLRHSAPLPEAQHFSRTQKLITRLRTYEQEQPQQYRTLVEQTERYFPMLKEAKTNDKAVARLPSTLFLCVVGLIIGWPFFVYGLVNNLLPVGIVLAITRKLNLYVGYNSSVKILGGLLFFPLFYLLQSWIVGTGFGTAVALLYLLSLYPMGWLAWKWWKQLQQFLAAVAARSASDQLKTAREAVWQRLAPLAE
jgi:1-acyl-sn-glycerol-3-phosphate acyltransferase